MNNSSQIVSNLHGCRSEIAQIRSSLDQSSINVQSEEVAKVFEEIKSSLLEVVGFMEKIIGYDPKSVEQTSMQAQEIQAFSNQVQKNLFKVRKKTNDLMLTQAGWTSGSDSMSSQTREISEIREHVKALMEIYEFQIMDHQIRSEHNKKLFSSFVDEASEYIQQIEGSNDALEGAKPALWAEAQALIEANELEISIGWLCQEVQQKGSLKEAYQDVNSGFNSLLKDYEEIFSKAQITPDDLLELDSRVNNKKLKALIEKLAKATRDYKEIDYIKAGMLIHILSRSFVVNKCYEKNSQDDTRPKWLDNLTS